MNWIVRGKLAFVVTIVGPIALIWLLDDVLHVGLYAWLEQVFGWQRAFDVLWIGWLLLAAIAYLAFIRKKI